MNIKPFVLGLLVDLKGRYQVTSNRESGFGRYDIMLEPVDVIKDDAIIKYEENLIAKGIPAERIRKYGFAFEGKRVLIG